MERTAPAEGRRCSQPSIRGRGRVPVPPRVHPTTVWSSGGKSPRVLKVVCRHTSPSAQGGPCRCLFSVESRKDEGLSRVGCRVSWVGCRVSRVSLRGVVDLKTYLPLFFKFNMFLLRKVSVRRRLGKGLRNRGLHRYPGTGVSVVLTQCVHVPTCVGHGDFVFVSLYSGQG